jgi:hypothetical protein
MLLFGNSSKGTLSKLTLLRKGASVDHTLCQRHLLAAISNALAEISGTLDTMCLTAKQSRVGVPLHFGALLVNPIARMPQYIRHST